MAKTKFTPENLIDNLDKLGMWSLYGLASEALQYYFPNEYDEDGYCPTAREAELLISMGFSTWDKVVIKHHKEIGYTAEQLSNKKFVNEH